MSDSATPKPRVISIRTEFIELAQLLKFAGFVDTGGAAKAVIQNGNVQLNGAVETQKGKKIVAGDRVTYNGETLLIERNAR